MPVRRSFVPLLPLLLFMLAGVFVLDISTPLGFAEGMLYVVPVMVAVWLTGRRVILVTAALSSLLVLGGAFWSHPGSVPWVVVVNRLYSLIIIWAVAVLALQRNRLLLAKERAYEDAERRVQERTDALTEALEREWKESEARQDAQKQLTGFLDVTLDAIITADDQQRIVVFNHGAERAFGYTAEEVIGKPLDILFVPELQAIHGETFARFAASAETSMPMATRTLVGCRRKNGAAFPCECTISKLAVNSGVFYTAILRDISDRVQAEQTLREQQANYRAVVENAREAISVTVEGRKVYVNPAYVQLYGRDRAQLIGSAPGQFVSPEEREAIARRVNALATGQPVGDVYEYRIKRPDGEERIIQASGVAITYQGLPAGLVVLRDVTEQARLLGALQEREEQYRTVVENATDGVLVVADGKYVYANKALLGIYGLQTLDQILSAEIGDFIVPEQREESRQRVQARLQGQPAPQLVEYPIRRPDGDVRTLQGAAAAITFGNKPASMLIVRDVTEARRIEGNLLESNRRLQQALEDLRSAQQQLVRQERLGALGRMASGIVHDFNNALTPIVGFTEMMLEDPSLLDQKARAIEYLRQCNASARNAHEIVGRLRDFYRPREQSESFSPVDVNDIVRQAVSLTEFSWGIHSGQTGRTINVRRDLSPLPAIQGNATELTEALVNLILNAVDAMPRGGEILLRTRPHETGVEFEVRDTGIGMSEEVRLRCLEPFFTTKGEHGTGLGLPVVYGVVQRHNGEILIESELGHGAAFRIRLPA